MKIFLNFVIVALLVAFFHTHNFSAHDALTAEDAKAAQAKLIEALKSLKKEIRTEVAVENGGTITGTVKCKRVRHPQDVVVYIEEVNNNDYPAPEEKGVLDQLNLTFVPHVIAVQNTLLRRRGIIVIIDLFDINNHVLRMPYSFAFYGTGNSTTLFYGNLSPDLLL